MYSKYSGCWLQKFHEMGETWDKTDPLTLHVIPEYRQLPWFGKVQTEKCKHDHKPPAYVQYDDSSSQVLQVFVRWLCSNLHWLLNYAHWSFLGIAAQLTNLLGWTHISVHSQFMELQKNLKYMTDWLYMPPW